MHSVFVSQPVSNSNVHDPCGIFFGRICRAPATAPSRRSQSIIPTRPSKVGPQKFHAARAWCFETVTYSVNQIFRQRVGRFIILGSIHIIIYVCTPLEFFGILVEKSDLSASEQFTWRAESFCQKRCRGTSGGRAEG